MVKLVCKVLADVLEKIELPEFVAYPALEEYVAEPAFVAYNADPDDAENCTDPVIFAYLASRVIYCAI